MLETFDLARRIDRVLEFLNQRLGVLRLSRELGEATRGTLEKRQREALLREQLATIRKELGEDEGTAAEVEDLKKAIAEAGMPEEVEQQANKELRRLERMPEAAAEHGMLRTYLDTLIELPWAKETEDRIDVAEAQRVLDEDHYDLEKIKKRIVEYLAVRKLAPEGRSPILCFVGPPGVGKTSLGQSIARAMGRKFARVSLGGVHDESEIRGHRRTYVGALPGNIIQAIRKVGVQQPGHDAGRDGQAGHGLPRRPVGGAARGARPRAELDLPRRLPRRAVRPQPRPVHRHRQHAGHHPRARCATGWR